MMSRILPFPFINNNKFEVTTLQNKKVNRLERTLPVMHWVTELVPTTLIEGLDTAHADFKSEQRHVVNELEDRQRRAEIADNRERAEELRKAAKALNLVAEKLEDKIASTTALFHQLHNNIINTDNRYANEFEDIKRQIESYIQRMGALRDSFGNMFTTAADGVMYFGSSTQSILNKDEISEASWGMFDQMLRLAMRDPSPVPLFEQDYANLAWFYTLQESIAGQERFINMLAQPVTMTHPANMFYDPRSEFDMQAYRVCPDIIANIMQNIENRISETLTEQMSLNTRHPNRAVLDAQWRDLAQRLDVLTVIQQNINDPFAFTRMDTHHPVFIGDAAGNGPFSLQSIQNGASLTFHTGFYRTRSDSPIIDLIFDNPALGLHIVPVNQLHSLESMLRQHNTDVYQGHPLFIIDTNGNVIPDWMRIGILLDRAAADIRSEQYAALAATFTHLDDVGMTRFLQNMANFAGEVSGSHTNWTYDALMVANLQYHIINQIVNVNEQLRNTPRDTNVVGGTAEFNAIDRIRRDLIQRYEILGLVYHFYNFESTINTQGLEIRAGDHFTGDLGATGPSISLVSDGRGGFSFAFTKPSYLIQTTMPHGMIAHGQTIPGHNPPGFHSFTEGLTTHTFHIGETLRPIDAQQRITQRFVDDTLQRYNISRVMFLANELGNSLIGAIDPSSLLLGAIINYNTHRQNAENANTQVNTNNLSLVANMLGLNVTFITDQDNNIYDLLVSQSHTTQAALNVFERTTGLPQDINAVLSDLNGFINLINILVNEHPDLISDMVAATGGH